MKLVTKTEFSSMAGVTQAAVTKALKGKLNPAMVGKRIDAGHPAAVAYLAKVSRPKSSEPKPPKPPPLKPTRTIAAKKKEKSLVALNGQENKNEQVLHEIPEDILMFANMTLRELIQRFGTEMAFLDWLKATKEIEAINEKRIKNAQSKNELISRTLVKTGVLDPISTVFQKLLTDGAKTMALRISSMTAAGRPVEDCEKFIIDQISSFIKPAKAKMKRALRNPVQ